MKTKKMEKNNQKQKIYLWDFGGGLCMGKPYKKKKKKKSEKWSKMNQKKAKKG